MSTLDQKGATMHRQIFTQATFIILGTLLVFPSWTFADLSWTGCGISKKAYLTEVAKAFEKDTGIKIDISGGGATKGIRAVFNEETDIGGSCRHLIKDPQEKNIRLHPVAWAALVIITNKANPVDNITHEHLKKVFLGQITNWKDLGGDDHPIEVFIRKGKISGVGMMARELVFGNADLDFAGGTREFKSTGPLEKAVVKERYAIALDGISSAKKRDVKFLTLNGKSPIVENIASGQYILYRPLYLVTKKMMTPEVKEFIAYIKSKQGQEIIASQGTVTMKQGTNLWKPYRKNMKAVVGKNKGVFE
jgi:phosphate transport system substrate-binding protein